MIEIIYYNNIYFHIVVNKILIKFIIVNYKQMKLITKKRAYKIQDNVSKIICSRLPTSFI